MTTKMDLRKFKSLSFAPPGGKWFYKIPDTEIYIESINSLYEVEYKARQYYKNNSKPVPKNIPALIQNYMCSKLPEGICTGEPDPAGRKKYLDFFSILKFTERLFRDFARGRGAYASSKVAQERALVCKACPANALHLCTSCSGLRNTAAKLVGGRKIEKPLASYLGICEYTGCVISGQVFVDGEWLYTTKLEEPLLEAGEELPTECWMNKKR